MREVVGFLVEAATGARFEWWHPIWMLAVNIACCVRLIVDTTDRVCNERKEGHIVLSIVYHNSSVSLEDPNVFAASLSYVHLLRMQTS